MLSKRIIKESERIRADPPPYISVSFDQDNLLHLEAKIMSPPDIPYEGGVFLLDVNIPTEYSMSLPIKWKYMLGYFNGQVRSLLEYCGW
ncbi:hypothetical protein RhiirA5_438753 [Rhizophagus irregularis]|uniref:UBC core domain-containing protein n=1 Tax=Rhizophagus irregularis TaxID=588596 RepID=A0A2N0NIQ9_9GLOM|nr:hypothetical protein RhiirA5_438753 [Rhizophagus irregularis]